MPLIYLEAEADTAICVKRIDRMSMHLPQDNLMVVREITATTASIEAVRLLPKIDQVISNLDLQRGLLLP